ncbi:CD83 antigen-like isoform X2 [Scyliorhinus torazame]|uniref:CD83 antigen-like isoform X2 n=1 Tax=Scyliorhinus torazame TaxID=75743 RepID=UPI003B5AF84B
MEFLSGCRPERSIFLFLTGVLLHLHADAVTEVFIRLGEIAELPCEASYVPEVQYRAISWYKVADDGFSLSGIVRRDFRENISRKYLGFDGSVEVASAKPYALTIHNVSGEDMGTYRCSMWAPLGKRNKEADMRLMIKVDDSQSAGITWIILISIIMAMCVLLILCMSLLYRRHFRANQMSEKMKNFSQPFGDRKPFYSNI